MHTIRRLAHSTKQAPVFGQAPPINYIAGVSLTNSSPGSLSVPGTNFSRVAILRNNECDIASCGVWSPLSVLLRAMKETRVFGGAVWTLERLPRRMFLLNNHCTTLSNRGSS